MATNVGGIPEIIRQGRNGLPVQPSAENLSMAHLKLRSDRRKRARMNMHNQYDAASHVWKSASVSYVNLYEQL